MLWNIQNTPLELIAQSGITQQSGVQLREASPSPFNAQECFITRLWKHGKFNTF